MACPRNKRPDLFGTRRLYSINEPSAIFKARRLVDQFAVDQALIGQTLSLAGQPPA